jgi:hypothetical protein
MGCCDQSKVTVRTTPPHISLEEDQGQQCVYRFLGAILPLSTIGKYAFNKVLATRTLIVGTFTMTIASPALQLSIGRHV